MDDPASPQPKAFNAGRPQPRSSTTDMDTNTKDEEVPSTPWAYYARESGSDTKASPDKDEDRTQWGTPALIPHQDLDQPDFRHILLPPMTSTPRTLGPACSVQKPT